jgi:hypothetical protein
MSIKGNYTSTRSASWSTNNSRTTTTKLWSTSIANWHGHQNQNNYYNKHGYNQNNEFKQRSIRCFCYCKGHVRKDCPIWKKTYGGRIKEVQTKSWVNVAMVDWDNYPRFVHNSGW